MTFFIEGIKNTQFRNQYPAAELFMGHAFVSSVLKPAVDTAALSLETTFHTAHVHDYSLPQGLSVDRQRMLRQPLREIVALHGFDAMFTRGLLTPEEIEAKWYAFAAEAPFDEVLCMYKEAINAWERARERAPSAYAFPIPDVRLWSETFDRDVETLSGVAFFSRYKDLESLKEFGVISPQCYRRLKNLMLQFESEKESLRSRKCDIQSAYIERLSDLDAQYDADIFSIKLSYIALEDDLLEMLGQSDEEIALQTYRKCMEIRDKEEETFERIQSYLFWGGRGLSDLNAEEVALYEHFFEYYQESMAFCDGFWERLLSGILSDMNALRERMMADLEEARVRLEGSVNDCYRQHLQKCERVEREMDRAIEQQVVIPLRDLEQELNQCFDRLFA